MTPRRFRVTPRAARALADSLAPPPAVVDLPNDERADRLEAEAADLAEPLAPPTSRRANAVVGSALLVPSPTGRRWSYRNFARAWDHMRRLADFRLAKALLRQGVPRDAVRGRLIAGLQRRDFRRTGMVRMAQAGATTAQIAAVSGHTIDRVQRILDVYIPRRAEVAAGAIAAWERGANAGIVISLPIARRK